MPGEGKLARNVGGGEPDAAETTEPGFEEAPPLACLDAARASWSGKEAWSRSGVPWRERVEASRGVVGGESEVNGLGASS